MAKTIKTKAPIDGTVDGATTAPEVVKSTETLTTSGNENVDSLKAQPVEELNVLKQQKIADVLTAKGSADDGAPGGMMAMRMASYSGNDAKISGNLAATPSTAGDSRGKSRYEKKIDETVRSLDDLASEQVIVKVTKPKPLSKGGVQGSNRANRNDITVRTKAKGKVPASHLFQRSLDEIRKDKIVFGHGQVVKSANTDYQDIPDKTLIWNPEKSRYEEGNFGVTKRGDFIPRTLTFKLGADGVVKDFAFSCDDITVNENLSDAFINLTASHAKAHANSVEMQRRVMSQTAGDENVDNWSPLPEAIKQPAHTLAYLKDMERDTGNHMYMAARFSQLSLAYQLNSAGKDGSQKHLPMVEAFISAIHGEDSSCNYGNDKVPDLFSCFDDVRNGSPALLIAAFDSTTKYKTKGDILNMPRSLKMLVNKGMGFVKNFKANPDLVKVLENTQAFSTIDGQYDGIRPVYVNDSYAITSPFDWRRQFTFEGKTAFDPHCRTGMEVAPFIYSFKDLRTEYITIAHHPLLKGIYNWISQHGVSLYRAAATQVEIKNKDDIPFNIPILYSLTKLTTWQFLLMAASSEIEKERLVTMKEIFDYERKNGKTAFPDLISLDSVNYTHGKLFKFVSIGEPLIVGSLDTMNKINWLMPELFWAYDEETRGITFADHRRVVVPWYFTEEQFSVGTDPDTVVLDPYVIGMSWPKVRSGIVMELLADIVNSDERQVRLGLDRMIAPIVYGADRDDFRVYKYDLSADGIPAIVFKSSDITYHSLLSVPRELGIIMDAPANYVTFTKPAVSRATLNTIYEWESSYRAKIYVGDYDAGTCVGPVLVNESVNVDRGSLYQQSWYYVPAIRDSRSCTDGGFLLSMKDLFVTSANGANATMLAGKSAFTPFAEIGTNMNQEASTDAEDVVFGFQKALWTRIQLLPMVISPWDTSAYKASAGVEDGSKYDIFDIAYVLGFVGFEGSFYDEDHYNRIDKQIQEGPAFVRDLYLTESPLIL
jgi:hypothetical protein